MYNTLKSLIIYLVLLFHTSYCHAETSADLKIVVSIKPFYNLVAAVTNNICPINVLVHGNQSIHDYTMKPSDLRMLEQANIIFWGGDNIEPFLKKIMRGKQQRRTIIALAELPAIEKLPLRNLAHSRQQHPHQHANNSENFDPHFWLSPYNAKVMVTNIASILSKADPNNAPLYQNNANNFLQRLQTLDAKIKTQLANIKTKPYLVGHDAYQYLEKHYELNSIGAITIHPEIPPSIKHLQIMQQLIHAQQVQCVFGDPQFSSTLIKSLLTPNMKQQILDPVGKDIDMGKDGYLILIQDLTENMSSCLQ